MISLFISALCEGRQPTIYGDGEQTRDFTYVANVVDGVLRACEAKEASGHVINVATGGRISLNQLFQTIRNLLGVDIEPSYEAPRAGDVRDSQADITKARQMLGYEPKASFTDGLAQNNRLVSDEADRHSLTPALRPPPTVRCVVSLPPGRPHAGIA